MTGATNGCPPIPLLTAAEMREWDRSAIDAAGIPERVLMENAGRAAARVVAKEFPRGRIVGVIGPGKNGGDGVVMLRTLAAWGREVVAVPTGSGALPKELLAGREVSAVEDLRAACRGASVLVDAVLGTGARGAPRGDAAAAVDGISNAGLPVVALDGPSGVDLTDGSVAGNAVRADLTISFGAPKRGHLLFPGRGRVGRLVVVEVGFPPLAPEGAAAGVIGHDWARARQPIVYPGAHKGMAGKVVVVAGHPGMGGAAILAAMGALRAGAGGVRVVSHELNRLPIQTSVPEALFVDRAGPDLEDVFGWADALVVGPGMGTDDQCAALLRMVLEHGTGGMLLDADALTLLARDPTMLHSAAVDRVLLTPHPGEMGRLLERPVGDVAADPFGAAGEAADRFGCTVLLKGSPSLVAAPGRATLVNVTGHSGIATGGMGDTLGGICASLMAAGCSPRDAAGCGLYLAGRAAEIAGRGRSLLPRDVAEALPHAFGAREQTSPEPGVLLDLPAAR